MTAQDRINQLAQAALRSAPPTGSAPKPATYMPSFEQMRSEQFIEKAAAAKTEAAAPVAATPAAPSPTVVKDAEESDKDLTSLLDQRDEAKGKKLRRASLAVTCTLLALCTGAGAFVTFNPTAKRKMNSVVTAFQQSGKDLKSLTSIMDTYENQLDKVAVQGARIDAATMALGVDPNTDTSGQDASINAAMTDMSGGGAGGPTVSERDAALKAKFGVVGKLAKDMAPEAPKAESDVQF
ncbi:hypothetical protein OJ996_21555 [Luteolibacter sp. GHJ8]|uniref:Uncharacterized protein n=1 Tax=Luteolibacter rhizosphaerae TaxID=2989719 RepID=A0ABT3G8L1_9BACT|nr:hypothetical protein [Luteolibacter rhizosphaerae]MCW1916191.1 hypothetical protein [Luteolibacter rhizosphaerae]